MKAPCLIFIIFSLWFCSCGSSSSADEKQVADYLQSIGLRQSDTMLYCFIPGNQCRNCFYYQGSLLSDFTNRHLQVITEFPTSHFTGFVHVRQDTSHRMLSLPILDYGNRFMLFQQGRVQSIPLTDLYTQADSLVSMFFKN